jgi:hypothetical protein
MNIISYVILIKFPSFFTRLLRAQGVRAVVVRRGYIKPVYPAPRGCAL